MNQNLYVITGASRGMGFAIAEQLLRGNHTLLCISRNSNHALAARAARLGGQLEQWSLSLEYGIEVSARLVHWLNSQEVGRFANATLINNAGVIPRIAPLSASDPVELSRAIRVGLEAPMLLTGAFLRATEQWGTPRKVLNISSGLGRRPMASQAAYCAAKAGMDHFTRCLALDEALKVSGARVCALAPGVIDTDMQRQLRDAEASVFPDRQSFADLKAHGQLTSPAEAATQILTYLARDDFGRNPIGDLRD